MASPNGSINTNSKASPDGQAPTSGPTSTLSPSKLIAQQGMSFSNAVKVDQEQALGVTFMAKGGNVNVQQSHGNVHRKSFQGPQTDPVAGDAFVTQINGASSISNSSPQSNKLRVDSTSSHHTYYSPPGFNSSNPMNGESPVRRSSGGGAGAIGSMGKTGGGMEARLNSTSPPGIQRPPIAPGLNSQQQSWKAVGSNNTSRRSSYNVPLAGPGAYFRSNAFGGGIFDGANGGFAGTTDPTDGAVSAAPVISSLSNSSAPTAANPTNTSNGLGAISEGESYKLDAQSLKVYEVFGGRNHNPRSLSFSLGQEADQVLSPALGPDEPNGFHNVMNQQARRQPGGPRGPSNLMNPQGYDAPGYDAAGNQVRRRSSESNSATRSSSGSGAGSMTEPPPGVGNVMNLMSDRLGDLKMNDGNKRWPSSTHQQQPQQHPKDFRQDPAHRRTSTYNSKAKPIWSQSHPSDLFLAETTLYSPTGHQLPNQQQQQQQQVSDMRRLSSFANGPFDSNEIATKYFNRDPDLVSRRHSLAAAMALASPGSIDNNAQLVDFAHNYGNMIDVQATMSNQSMKSTERSQSVSYQNNRDSNYPSQTGQSMGPPGIGGPNIGGMGPSSSNGPGMNNNHMNIKGSSNFGKEFLQQTLLDQVFDDDDDMRIRSWSEPVKKAALQMKRSEAITNSSELFVIEFKGGRSDVCYVNSDSNIPVTKGDLVIVEADRGKDLGKVVRVNLSIKDVVDPANGKELKPKVIYRHAQPTEVSMLLDKARDEAKALAICKAKCKQKGLDMEVVDAEYQWDRKKLTFFFLAEGRIDFRELVKDLFKIYKTRIWMCAVERNLTNVHLRNFGDDEQ